MTRPAHADGGAIRPPQGDGRRNNPLGPQRFRSKRKAKGEPGGRVGLWVSRPVYERLRLLALARGSTMRRLADELLCGNLERLRQDLMKVVRK